MGELFAGFETKGEGRSRAHVPPGWMQGRTTYGGLSAALCLLAAQPLSEGLPLRIAQVAFIGPAGGDLDGRAELLRKGRNTVWAEADLSGEKGLATRAMFGFGAARESHLDQDELSMPEGVPRPHELPSFFREAAGPHFTRHFDLIQAVGEPPFSGSDTAEIGLWIRLREESPPLGPATLLALGDAPPPAIMPAMREFGPISSMSWMAEFTDPDAQARAGAGWHYLHHRAERTRGGYSTQSMRLFDEEGRCLMVGRQTVAVFS